MSREKQIEHSLIKKHKIMMQELEIDLQKKGASFYSIGKDYNINKATIWLARKRPAELKTMCRIFAAAEAEGVDISKYTRVK